MAPIFHEWKRFYEKVWVCVKCSTVDNRIYEPPSNNCSDDNPVQKRLGRDVITPEMASQMTDPFPPYVDVTEEDLWQAKLKVDNDIAMTDSLGGFNLVTQNNIVVVCEECQQEVSCRVPSPIMGRDGKMFIILFAHKCQCV